MELINEAIGHDDMDVKMRLILIVASTLGNHALGEYKVMATGL